MPQVAPPPEEAAPGPEPAEEPPAPAPAPEAPGTAAGPAVRETSAQDAESPGSTRPEAAGPRHGPTDRGQPPQDAEAALSTRPEAALPEHGTIDRARPPLDAPEASPEASAPGRGAEGHPSPPRDAPEPVRVDAVAPSWGEAATVVPEAARHGLPDRASEGAGDGVFKVRLANFEGPFDLLLQLISKHRMDVTEVALSKVTDEFMAHIRAMGPDWDLDETTEFLVVAATLLDLKAARLLPAAEVEDEADLALLEARDLLFARLLQYRAYKQIAEIFNGRLEAEARRYPRTVGLEPHHAELLPEVVISIGPEGFAKLAVKAMQPRPKPQVYVEHIHAPLVSVQEQAQVVVARLRELGEASFRVLVDDTEDTLTVVARFLALLELYREKAVALDQETALGDLLVRWTGGDGDTGPVVTDEFDREPVENEKTEEEQPA
ncbi:segregation/condensation protein A [Streptomyces sp. NPDC048219]|uniref:segregation and condensation protein A n=1 Tax=Streptomyces sp. NPDC048219 TaxID=3365517 RepID=UPI003722579D